MLSGSAFQAIGPATEKARRPNCVRRWRGTTSWLLLAECRCWLLAILYIILYIRVDQLTIVLYCKSTDHDEPWGSHAVRQIQQKSYLHRLHTMWLQPPSFSMVAWHLGHSCRQNHTSSWTQQQLIYIITDSPQFKHNLKTHLFNIAFN